MSKISEYKSRQGNLTCSSEDLFYFLSDIRNFERFIPKGTVSDLSIAQDSCTFDVPMLGTVSVRISEKIPFSQVVFSGNAMHVNEFGLVADIKKTSENQSEVNVTLLAELNPFIKMAADKPILNFLDKLIIEMERFNDWKNITV